MKYTATYLDDLTAAQGSVPNLEQIFGTKILITGATGLVGSAIVDFLLNLNDTRNAGITVYIAARSLQKAEDRFEDRIQIHDVVFVEYDALKTVSWDFDLGHIIVGASPANPALYASEPVETMLTNLLGIYNVLAYAREHSVKRVVFVSSSEVYGKKENTEPYKEGEYGYVDILNPRACYPSAKRTCETLCASYRDEYGVDSVIVRLGHIYGPTATRQDTRASSQFFFHVLDGHDIVMKSAGSQLRSYVYVPDCASAIMAVLVNGDPGGAYNISNPNSIVTIRELAEEIAGSAGRKVTFENPSDIELKGYNLMENSSLESSKLLELGWQPLFDAETGIRHTFDIMRG